MKSFICLDENKNINKTKNYLLKVRISYLIKVTVPFFFIDLPADVLSSIK